VIVSNIESPFFLDIYMSGARRSAFHHNIDAWADTVPVDYIDEVKAGKITDAEITRAAERLSLRASGGHVRSSGPRAVRSQHSVFQGVIIEHPSP
jgi:hypothetical protein